MKLKTFSNFLASFLFFSRQNESIFRSKQKRTSIHRYRVGETVCAYQQNLIFLRTKKEQSQKSNQGGVFQLLNFVPEN